MEAESPSCTPREIDYIGFQSTGKAYNRHWQVTIHVERQRAPVRAVQHPSFETDYKEDQAIAADPSSVVASCMALNKLRLTFAHWDST